MTQHSVPVTPRTAVDRLVGLANDVVAAFRESARARQGVSVRPGDRLVKTGDTYQSLWVVDAIITFDDHPPHARLHSDADPRETRTISCLVLQNPRFFRRLKGAR